jgi:MOSC domain-containing protein YiiM
MPRKRSQPTGVVAGVLIADGEDFVSRPIGSARLIYGGIEGDLHAGPTRPSCSRAPWHERATEIANTRQLSLVSVEECAQVAEALDVPELDPRLLGANLVVRGIADFSGLAPATRLQFPSGATIFITEANGPCIQPGHRLAKAFGRKDLVFGFVNKAIGRRGLVGLVERPGPVSVGDEVAVILSPTRRTG